MTSLVIENLCKLCLNESSLDGNLSELVISETPVLNIVEKIIYKLEWTDDVIFPDKICSECLEIVKSVHQLNVKCLESDVRLKKFIETNDESEILVEEIVTVVTEDDDGQEQNLERKSKATKSDVDAAQQPESVNETISEDEHKCQHCNKTFDKASRLLRHIKIHDSTRKAFACQAEGCFARFTTPESLMRHEIIHSGMTIKINEEKLHECVVCNKEFLIQEALASHMKTHRDVLDDIEFQCSLCTSKFRKLNDLARHAKTHPENKSYKCLICAKTFSQGSHLIDHLNRHNNLRPHVCKICNKGKLKFAFFLVSKDLPAH